MPITLPAAGQLVLLDSSPRAMPKSVTFARPSSSISTFCGFTSRWTSPRSCAACSARPISIAYATASATGSGPSRRMRSLRVSPAHVLEDDVGVALVLAGVDHHHDVRVGELRDRARLAPESLERGVVARRCRCA